MSTTAPTTTTSTSLTLDSAENVSHAGAGAAGGMIAMALLYPLENIRTRLQVQIHHKAQRETSNGVDGTIKKPPAAASRPRLGSLLTSSTSPSARGEPVYFSDTPSESYYSSTWDCFKQVVMSEGWQQLYNGLSSAVIGVGVSSAIYFFWYHSLKQTILRRTGNKSLTPLENIFVASVAGVLNILITLPIWTVNTRMTLARKSDTVKYDSLYDTIKHMYQHEGLAGFYKGLIPSIILVSNPAIQFVCYEQTIKLLTRHYRDNTTIHIASINTPSSSLAASTTTRQPLSWLTYFIVGAFAKAIATIITYPTQVLKSRLQANESDNPTLFTLVTHMFEHEGILSFYNGMEAKMTQTVLNSAFTFMIYERLHRLFQKSIVQFLKIEHLVENKLHQ